METIDIFERLRNGETVSNTDPQMTNMRSTLVATKKLLLEMNNTADMVNVRSLLSQITGSMIDDSVTVFTPLYVNYGKHTRIGKNVFINFNCTFLDLGGITIEDDVYIAPNVSILSEGHPIEPEKRHSLAVGHVHINQNVWIGAGAIILKGVTIGENSIIAAGAVVSKDVPANTLVGGIPAQVLKLI